MHDVQYTENVQYEVHYIDFVHDYPNHAILWALNRSTQHYSQQHIVAYASINDCSCIAIFHGGQVFNEKIQKINTSRKQFTQLPCVVGINMSISKFSHHVKQFIMLMID